MLRTNLTLRACLAGFDAVSLIQDHDLGCQRLQLVLQLGYKVVAGDEKLKLSAFQLAVLTLPYITTIMLCCNTKKIEGHLQLSHKHGFQQIAN